MRIRKLNAKSLTETSVESGNTRLVLVSPPRYYTITIIHITGRPHLIKSHEPLDAPIRSDRSNCYSAAFNLKANIVLAMVIYD